MKILKNKSHVIYFIISLMMISANTFAQIMVKTKVHQNIVKFRWSPAKYDLMRKGQQYGYTIRKINAQGTTQTQVIKPYTTAQWNQKFSSGHEGAQAARQLLSDLPVFVDDQTKFDPDTIANKKFSHAYCE